MILIHKKATWLYVESELLIWGAGLVQILGAFMIRREP